MCDLEQCPTCTSPQPLSDCLLGVLGSLAHFRCRYCGWQWTSPVNRLPDDYEPGDVIDAEA